MCSDGFLGLWIEHDCQPNGQGIFPTAHSRDSQFGVLVQHSLGQIQDLLVVSLFDDVFVVKLVISQFAFMPDKLDALGLEVEFVLAASNICDQHRIVFLRSLYRGVGWSTVRVVSIPRCSSLSPSFISYCNLPSKNHGR